ncbi:MAG: tRNA uracil 4-sulfurtransferase ThiI [Halobacteriales archaeon]|nr:tRNA uracil 4-sulfurtransferase ThiI [Halobacteriales archaeon]
MESRVPDEADTVLVRYGEIGVKSSCVRQKMEETLRRNVARAVERHEVEATVELVWSRVYVEVGEDNGNAVEEATEAASDVFGVSSASPCVVVEAEIDEIADALVEVARDCYEGGSFAVDARRAGDEDAHPFTSEDIEEEGGAAVEDALDAPVDLDAPDNVFGVECRLDRAFVYAEVRDGPGGLPYGTQAGVVALVSGGIDSPVAVWRAMRRGCPVTLVYIDLGKYGGADHVARAYETAETLAGYTPDGIELWHVPGEEAIETLLDETEDTRMLSYRRFMLRVAEGVAEEAGGVGVVTGEAVGQKSSQTSRNLHATDAAVDMPVHRPLLSFDKPEIVAEARRIGTYSTSKVDAGCHSVAPSHPETGASLKKVREAEPDGLFELADEAVEDGTVEEFE